MSGELNKYSWCWWHGLQYGLKPLDAVLSEINVYSFEFGCSEFDDEDKLGRSAVNSISRQRVERGNYPGLRHRQENEWNQLFPYACCTTKTIRPNKKEEK